MASLWRMTRRAHRLWCYLNRTVRVLAVNKKSKLHLEDRFKLCRREASRHGNLEDLVAKGAARHADLGGVAAFLADEPLSDGTGDEDLVLHEVVVAGADQLVNLFFVQVQVLDTDTHAEDDGVGGQSAAVHDVGPAQLVLERV